MGNKFRRWWRGDPNNPNRGSNPHPSGPKSVKIVLVGDTAVGKSALITNYMTETFDDKYEPSVLDVFKGSMTYKQQELGLEIHDTSGDEHLGTNRQISYNRTDCFMLCVSAVNRDSFESISKWQTEIRLVCPNTPILLVSTKSDLRQFANANETVSERELESQKQNDFMDWRETSSKNWRNDDNVKKAFYQAANIAFLQKYDYE